MLVLLVSAVMLEASAHRSLFYKRGGKEERVEVT